MVNICFMRSVPWTSGRVQRRDACFAMTMYSRVSMAGISLVREGPAPRIRTSSNVAASPGHDLACFCGEDQGALRQCRSKSVFVRKKPLDIGSEAARQ